MKFKRILCAVLCIASLLMLTSCHADISDENTTEAEIASAELVSELGEGEKSFYFSVFYADGTSDNLLINTDKTTVGEALLDLNLIDGEEGPYGLYIKSVNGVTADYDTDGTYWAFYVNGEYASQSADLTDIQDGALYSFRVEQ